MKAYKSFLRWYRATLATACSVGSVFVADYFQARIDQTTGLFLTLLLAVIAFAVFERLMEEAIERATWLRKLMWDPLFLEGTWLDVVKERGKDEIVFGAVLDIQFRNGEMVYHGRAYLPDGRWYGEFHSTGMRYLEDDRISIPFVASSELNKQDRVIGIGEYYIGTDTNPPISFSGYYIESDRPVAHHTDARKVTDDRLLTRLANTDEWGAVVAEFIQKQSKLPTLPSETLTAQTQTAGERES